MSDERKICTFLVGEHCFGIDVAEVQEVIRYQDMTQVPLADETISGLINLRGQIVTAIDMNKRLGFSAITAQKLPTNIIVRTTDAAVSLLVDDIGDVIDLSADNFEAPPKNLQGDLRRMLKDVCKLENALLLILDLEQVLIFDQEDVLTN